MLRSALLLFALPFLSSAIDLRIQYGALERMLSEQVFTQDGRRYVYNTKDNKCNFAYLENPHLEAADGRLRIRARFTGRSSLNMFGKCVGLGDAFGVLILALPEYKNGSIGLNDVTVQSDGHSGYYVRRVCEAISSSLLHDFRYPVLSAARDLLENPAPLKGYPREMRGFQVNEIRVVKDALVLSVDFELTVK